MIEPDNQQPKNKIILFLIAMVLVGLLIFSLLLNKGEEGAPEPIYNQDETIKSYSSSLFKIEILKDNNISISAAEGYRDKAVGYIKSESSLIDYKINFKDYRNPFNDYE